MIFTPSWQKQMSLFVFLDCLKIITWMYNSCLLMLSLSWQNLVMFSIILYYMKTNNLADDFRSEMEELNCIAYLIGLLQDHDTYRCQSAFDVITALAKFGKLINYFILWRDWWSHRQFPLQNDRIRCCYLSCWLASKIRPTWTKVICWCYYCLSKVWYVIILFWTIKGLIIK